MALISAVIVHHNNYPDVLDTINCIVDGGVSAEDLILVDNSGDPLTLRMLEESCPRGVTILDVPNDGYGAAANRGIAWMSEHRPDAEFILVSTHETKAHPGAIQKLIEVAGSDKKIAVAGPVLLTPQAGAVWSAGGSLDQWTRKPVHLGHPPTSDRDVLWLDGAFCLYRREALRSARFDENYVMYYEEVDLHLRLRAAGWRIVVSADSLVEQSTGGMPPYYAGRSGVLFLRAHGTPIHVALLILRESLRILLRGAPNRGRLQSLREFFRGVKSVGTIQTMVRDE